MIELVRDGESRPWSTGFLVEKEDRWFVVATRSTFARNQDDRSPVVGLPRFQSSTGRKSSVVIRIYDPGSGELAKPALHPVEDVAAVPLQLPLDVDRKDVSIHTLPLNESLTADQVPVGDSVVVV